MTNDSEPSFIKKIEGLSKLKPIKIIHEEEEILCVCAIDKGRFATCSSDKLIRVYNSQTYQCIFSLEGHTAPINYIEMTENGLLISCSRDCTIKLWEIFDNSGKILHNIQTKHSSNIFKAIKLGNNQICSCSADKTIEVFDNNFKCIQILTGHIGWIMSIIELNNKKYIVSAAGRGDETVRFWSNTTYQCEVIFCNIACGWNKCLKELKDNKLIICGEKISIIDLSNNQFICQITYPNLTQIDCFVELKNFFICGCYIQELGYSLMKVDSNTNKIIETKKEVHDNFVMGLLFLNEFHLLSWSDDKTIKIWNSS